jgi:hypothetical protein
MAYNGYVRVPPDGTGKAINHSITIAIAYGSGTQPFEIGDYVAGATSGIEGSVTRIDGVTAGGAVHLALFSHSPLQAIVGENLQVGGVTYALAASTGQSDIYYTPLIQLVDGKNAAQAVNVTQDGELTTTWKNGSPGLDAFGNLQVSQQMYLGLYKYDYGVDWGLLHPTFTFGAYYTTSSYYGGVILTNPTTSGSVTRIQSHMYHPYDAGTAQKWIGSFVCGDSGKNNLIRRWGYFDDKDGLFFELSGSAFSVVVRNSSTGVVVETKVPQSEWNSDRCDGTGGELNLSNADLDVTKGTVYGIDFQWLGVGRVRFGIVWNGANITCHEFDHNAELDRPYMRTGTLPARFEQLNVDTTLSISQISSFSMAVLASSRNDPFTEQQVGQTTDLTVLVSNTSSFKPYLSVRSKQLYQGKENRIVAIPTQLEVYAHSSPIVYQLRKWSVLDGATWSVPTSSYSSLEGDFMASSSITYPGTIVSTHIVKPSDLFLQEFPQEWDDAWKIYRKADITDDNCSFTLYAKLLGNATPTSMSVSMNWNEIF